MLLDATLDCAHGARRAARRALDGGAERARAAAVRARRIPAHDDRDDAGAGRRRALSVVLLDDVQRCMYGASHSLIDQGLRMHRPSAVAIASFALALATSHATAQSARTASTALERGFATPPNAAQPRVWWHWMNGNVTKEGITSDLEWMKRVGIGGFQMFDGGFGVPQFTEKRLVWMTPGVEGRLPSCGC